MILKDLATFFNFVVNEFDGSSGDETSFSLLEVGFSIGAKKKLNFEQKIMKIGGMFHKICKKTLQNHDFRLEMYKILIFLKNVWVKPGAELLGRCERLDALTFGGEPAF